MPERINKYLSSHGVCSRREADRMVAEGRVLVDGKTAVMGEMVDDSNTICIDGRQISSASPEQIIIAFNKPVGIVCTTKDRHNKNNIVDYIRYPERIYPVGRLDKESDGLILLTNDGDLIDAMMRGSAGHEKEYIVKVNKEVTEEFLARMEAGVFLKELNLTTRPCKAEKIGKFTFRIILTQGVNRQIRRMAGELSYHVNAIKRVRVVNIELANLKPGEFRQVKNDELQVLYNSCSVNKN